MSKLTPELQKLIEREGDGRAEGFETKLLASVAKVEYEIGAEIYAEKWQRAERAKERYEKALKEIHTKARKTIFPAQACADFDRYITELLTPKQPTDDTANG